MPLLLQAVYVLHLVTLQLGRKHVACLQPSVVLGTVEALTCKVEQELLKAQGRKFPRTPIADFQTLDANGSNFEQSGCVALGCSLGLLYTLFQ